MFFKSVELFPASFNEDFKAVLAHKYTEYVEAGGRGSCKSSFISILIVLLLVQEYDYNALILRKVSNTLRDSVYNQIKWAIEKLGLSHLFSYTLAPLQITYIPTGQIIYFRGADDPLKIKSIKPIKGYISLLWFEETAEFTINDVNTIKLSTMRGGEVFYNFYSYNPPSSSRSWVNNEFRTPRKDRLFHQSSYLTVPRSWLGDAFIFEAEEMKRTNERAYNNIFLGEPTGTGTNIFENIELREITEEEIAGFEWTYYGLDFGFYPDPTRFNAYSYDMKNKILYVYAELSLLKHGNYEASEKLRKFFQDNNLDETHRITADSAEPKSVADYYSYGWNIRGAVKGRGSLDAGFKWLQQLNKIVIDPCRCPKAADEFSLYEYEIDKRTGEIMTGYPQNQPDHSLANCRYALEEVWKIKGN